VKKKLKNITNWKENTNVNHIDTIFMTSLFKLQKILYEPLILPINKLVLSPQVNVPLTRRCLSVLYTIFIFEIGRVIQDKDINIYIYYKATSFFVNTHRVSREEKNRRCKHRDRPAPTLQNRPSPVAAVAGSSCPDSG